MTANVRRSRLRRFWPVLFLWLLAFTTVPLLMDQWRHRDAPSEVPRQLLPDLNGSYLDIHQMSMEQPVLVYFWATWCPVCRMVSPSVNALRDDYPIVAVAMTSGGPDRVLQYARKHDLGFRIVNDPDGHITQAWSVRATPTIAVVFRGEIHSMTSGITTPPGISLRLWIARLVGDPVSHDTSSSRTY